jgi:phosphoribosylformylglycinamidine synthase
LDTIHLSFQEYFPRVGECPERWGQVFAAMLGAFSAQMGLKIAAIGGKDSMSGTYDAAGIDVPPTLISFAFGLGEPAALISNEFKKAESYVYALKLPADYAQMRAAFVKFGELVKSGKVLSAQFEGSIANMCLGNMMGYAGEESTANAIVFEAAKELKAAQSDCTLLGRTQTAPEFNGTPLEQIRKDYESPLESVFSTRDTNTSQIDIPTIADERKQDNCQLSIVNCKLSKPKAVLPIFPGTNGEYDVQLALERAGGTAKPVVIRNLTPAMLEESVLTLESALKSAQMLIFPGGFAGGDEPDGSAKFMAALLRNPRLADAVRALHERGGLILGIGNGFQALLKLGLLDSGGATLTTNTIARHQARYVTTRVSCANSPWLSKCRAGELYLQPISCGQGRFTAPATLLESLKDSGQIALQYADFAGNASMDIAFNPTGADYAVAGLTSADGRVFGMMTHPERCRQFVAKNIPGEKHLPVFESGVKYFK